MHTRTHKQIAVNTHTPGLSISQPFSKQTVNSAAAERKERERKQGKKWRAVGGVLLCLYPMRYLGFKKRHGLSIVTSVPVSSVREREKERERERKSQGGAFVWDGLLNSRETLHVCLPVSRWGSLTLALEYGSVLGLIYGTFMFRMTEVTSLNLHSSQAF